MSAAWAKASNEDDVVHELHGPITKRRRIDNEPRIEALTYRVRRIPAIYNSFETLAFFLCDVEPALGPRDDIEVHSLANSLSPYDDTKIATIVFKKKPAILDNGKDEWTFQIRTSARERNFIVIDSHFSGFTVLNDPLGEQDRVDCIAISGLASHPFGSWRCRTEPSFMWLRDQLPRDLQQVRVILYGYNTRLVNSASFQSIFDIARTFSVALRAARGISSGSVPMVFVAHSFGGLVVKSALIQLAADTLTGQILSDSIKAILFFGTPSKGMNTAHFQAMVRGQANEALIKQLEVGSPGLQGLEEHFNGISTLRDIVKISMYETVFSPTAKMNINGQWTLSGTPDVLVHKDSAIQGGTRELDQHPINRTHSGMVKFAPDDMYYELIRTILHDNCQSSNGLMSFAQRRTVDGLASFSSRSESTVTTASIDIANTPLILPDDRVPRTIRHDILVSVQAVLQDEKPWQQIHGSLPTVLQFIEDVVLDEADMSQALLKSLRTSQAHRYLEFIHFIKQNYCDFIQGRMRRDLQFEEQHARLHQVQQAFKATFEWVFDKESLGLQKWLEGGKGLFWIRGKPGSGKSTLLKYLYGNARTRWSFDKSSRCQTILTSYFFHDRGSRAQKSLEGLVQSLISQMLESVPALEHLILPEYLKNGCPQDEIWPMERLNSLMDKIMLQQVLQLRVLLFLDALDEFHGDKDLLCSFISRLTASDASHATQICICFTSRPVQIFLDEFEQQPGLVIQEHTEDDITEFLQNKLTSKTHLLRLLSSNSHGKKVLEIRIVEEIRKRAKGVFLWVSLTIEKLSRAARDGTTTEQIEKILSGIPDELEGFYNSILFRIDPRYRHETYSMLDIAMRQQGCSAFVFDLASRFADVETHKECTVILDEYAVDSGTANLYVSFERRLRSRTGGLLELVSNPDAKGSKTVQSGNLGSIIPGASPYALKKVSFLHQTVKEYFAQSGVLSEFLLSSQVSQYGNGHSFLSKASLSVLICGNVRDNISEATCISQLFQTHAHESERTTGLDLFDFYCSIELDDLLTAQRSLRISNDFANAVLRSYRVKDEAADRIKCIAHQTQADRKVLAQRHIAIAANLQLLYSSVTNAEEMKTSSALQKNLMASNRLRESQQLLKILATKFCNETFSNSSGTYSHLEHYMRLLMANSEGKAGLAWKFVIAKAILDEAATRSTISDLICVMLKHGQDPNVPLWLDATALAVSGIIREPNCTWLTDLLVSYGAINLPCPIFRGKGFHEFSKGLDFLQHTYDFDLSDKQTADPFETLPKSGGPFQTPYPP